MAVTISLQGKVAIVTGGCRGIGKACFAIGHVLVADGGMPECG